MFAISDNWWLFGSTLAGAVVGAVVGGAFAYLLARKATRETLERDSKERIDRDKAAAFRLIVKISKIVSSFSTLKKHIDNAVVRAVEAKHAGDLWMLLEPLAPTSKRVDFEAEELSVLVPMNEYDLLNSLLILDDKHNIIMQAMEIYWVKRSEFGSTFGAKMDGHRGVTDLVGKAAELAGPRIMELHDLAESLRANVNEYVSEASQIVSELGPKLREHFHDPSFPLLAMADATEDKE
ncbi:MAG: hypothetical protein WBQ17_14685 [Rhizomicrobium sp.]